MDAVVDVQPPDEPASTGVVPGPRASSEGVSFSRERTLVGLEQLAELLDTVVVHAGTCEMGSVGTEAKRWSTRLRTLLGELAAPESPSEVHKLLDEIMGLEQPGARASEDAG